MSRALAELELRLTEYRAMAKLARDAGERAERQPDAPFVRDLGLPDLGAKTSDRKQAVRRYFDALQQTIFDQCFVGMVATFERWAFIHLANAIGEAKKAVGASYNATIAFARASERLVKDATDVGDLAQIEVFVACYPGKHDESLQELRQHRNWIAHGKRVGRQSRFNRIEDVYSVLCQVIQAIEGK